MEPARANRTTWRRALVLGLAPLLLLLCGVRSLPPEHAGQQAGQRQVYPVPKFRTVVVILDSLGTPMAFDPGLMPFTSSLASSSLFGEANACPGKLTFPCVKSIFEGRTATTGTTLQDFSAVASQRTTWPRSLAQLGLRLVLTSDHTLNRLYPDAFVDAMNYEELQGPLSERDAQAFERAREWLADPSIDVLLLHIIGTDTVAHDYPVGGPEYRAKYLEADNFIRDIAGRLSPNDYLYVIGDHGHNALGGHTEDAAYIAHGPLFPQGRHENLGAADMLFLLSVPYALTLPRDYEGHIRTDLTLLPEEERKRLLQAQAEAWRVPAGGASAEALEARLNDHVIRNRAEGQRQMTIAALWHVAPWLLAAALFLLSELGAPRESRFPARAAFMILFVLGLSLGLAGIAFGAWFAVAAALLRCWFHLGVARTGGALLIMATLSIAAFWIGPAVLFWFHLGKNQPPGWSIFYPIALLCGVIVTLVLGAASWRAHALRILWVVGVALWLLAYFGPYNYALTGRGSKIVLGLFVPLAIILAGGFRAFRSLATLCVLGLFPFVTFYTSSFNIEYGMTDRVEGWPMLVGLSLCAVTGILLMWASRIDPAPARGKRRWIAECAFLVLWLLVSAIFFQFDAGKLLGVLLGSLWLIGCLTLFRRAGVPSYWAALSGAILLFAVFHFVLDGFALSHVDFRFAANKIVEFQAEVWRAPQLILWVILKYLFVLLPPLAVFYSYLEGSPTMQMLRLGLWRQLMIVLSAFGLALFDRRGLEELCSEEIYFWTFLNLALWFLCLAIVWRERNRSEPAGTREEFRIPTPEMEYSARS